MEGKFNSERARYDTLVYFFTCFQFDPMCLLCEDLFLNVKVADKNSKFIYVAVCQEKWTELELVSAFILTLSQNTILGG